MKLSTINVLKGSLQFLMLSFQIHPLSSAIGVRYFGLKVCVVAPPREARPQPWAIAEKVV